MPVLYSEVGGCSDENGDGDCIVESKIKLIVLSFVQSPIFASQIALINN